MKQRMKDFMQWGKEHKGLLAVAGISITVLIALVLCARNKDEIDHILSLLKKGGEKCSGRGCGREREH